MSSSQGKKCFLTESLSVFDISFQDFERSIERDDLETFSRVIQECIQKECIECLEIIYFNFRDVLFHSEDSLCLKHLLSCGMSIETEDFHNCTLLTYSVMEGKVDLVRYLCESGAYVDHTDDEGNSCLFYSAVKRQSFEITEILLRFGANPNMTIETHRGFRSTISHHLFFCCSFKSELRKIIVLLLNYGLDPNIEDSHGNKPKDYIHPSDREEMMKILEEVKSTEMKEPDCE